MKPSWSTAPEWAKWLAMDEDGVWFWFEFKPYLNSDGVWRSDGGAYATAGASIFFRDSLETRA